MNLIISKQQEIDATWGSITGSANKSKDALQKGLGAAVESLGGSVDN